MENKFRAEILSGSVGYPLLGGVSVADNSNPVQLNVPKNDISEEAKELEEYKATQDLIKKMMEEDKKQQGVPSKDSVNKPKVDNEDQIICVFIVKNKREFKREKKGWIARKMESEEDR